ncbi:MAG: choice-of-anchor J domain-containing protein [Bacteroidales bacterium]|nr:choice-of-anchor J domain-containing protein [Bacteroidales bacterium]
MKKLFTLFVLLFSFMGLANAQNTENRDGQWYYYDNGEYLGYYSDISEWGIMLPAGSYVGNTLTKVSIFDCNTGNQPFYIDVNYGENEPSAFVGRIGVGSGIFTGSMDFVDFACDIPIDPSKNVWIIVDSYMPYFGVLNIPYCTNQGDPNGRWIYSGGEWGIAETSNNFMLRAYFEESTPLNYIDDIYVDGFTAPVWGAQADFDLTVPAGAHYAVDEVKWWYSTGQLMPGDAFDFEGYYHMEVRLSPEEGYAFSPGATVYFNGDATINDAAHNQIFDGRLKASTISFHVTAPSGDLSYDFEDGTLQGWFNIDADGDGHGWTLVSGSGHNSSGFVASESYDENTSMALDPDNYLILSDVKLGGSIKFWACAENQYYPEEHFGVAVSTTGTDPECFSNIQDWTLTAKQGSWHEYTADLGAFEGQTGYVAIRHYNSADNYRLNIDDIEFVEGGVTPQPTAITEIRLNGFTAPVWGAHPDVELTVPSDAHYTISEVTWFNNDGSITVTPETVYDQEGVYYMKVILAPAEDYVFDEEATVYFNDDASICDAGYNLILDNGNFRTFTVDYEVTNPSTTCTITAEPNPTEGGTATGGGTFNKGETCTLTATANSGYQFVNWTKNGSEVSTNATYSFTVTGSGNYLANFFPTQTKLYTLTVQCNPAEGAVTGNGTYAAGTVVEVQAIPYKGYAFDRWNDGNTQNPRSVTLDNNMTLVAFFKNTGVGESGVTALRVYPNPANDNLHIEGLEADTEVQFYNSLGMMVKAVNVAADQEVNISDLAPGMYVIHCGQQMLRFVKTN